MSEAATAIRWLLQQAEPEARRVAVQQIAKVRGIDAAELLLCALGDDDWRVRKEAAVVTPSLQQRDQVVAALVSALEDSVNIGLRNAAVEALVAIGSDAIPPTVSSLSRLDPDARKLAVEVLGGVADLRCTVALCGALHDDDANVRVAAAEALGRAALAGEESRELATRSLVDALSTLDPFLKIAALESLARLEAHLPWTVFEPYMANPLLRRHAIAAAGGSREPDAVRALARATGDPSPTIARDAIVAFGDLLAAIAGEDPILVRVAREALQRSPAGLVNARRAALNPEDPTAHSGALLMLGLGQDPGDVALLANGLGEEAAERAESGLRLFGPDAVEPLLISARRAKSAVRAAALRLATTLGGPATAEKRDGALVLGALREALEDSPPEVVASAIEALGRIGEPHDLSKIAAVLGHDDERIRAAATNALWELAARHVDAARGLLREPAPGQDSLALGCILLGAIASIEKLREEDMRILERALAHDRPEVRRAAIEAFAQSGGEASADAVVFALADESHEVQLAAVKALGRLGSAEPLASVVAVTRDPVLTAAALRALGEADPARAVSAAGPLVGHADAAIACAAVEAIGHLATNRVSTNVSAACEDALFSALDHPNAEVVKLSLSLVVGAQPGVRALARLGLCLDHGSWEVRRVAAELLGQDKGASAQALLRARYERERDPIVRNAIAAAVSLRPVGRTEIPAASFTLRPKEGK